MRFSQVSLSTINRLFNIKSGEWPGVLLLFLMAVLSNAGFTLGTIITYANFLQKEQAGIEALPVIFVLISVLSIVATAIYTAFVDRIANDRLLIIIFAVESAGILLGLALLQFNHPWANPFLYLLAFAVIAVINPHQITYFNGFYNTQAAKRTLPVVTAGYRIGGILVGLVMSLLTGWVGPAGIIIIWLATHIAVIVLTWRIPYILREHVALSDQLDYASPTAVSDSEKQRSSYIDSIKEGFRYISHSTFLRWMAIGTLLLMVLIALLWYRSTEILVQIYDDENNLANFLGLLTVIGNLIVLPMLFFGMSRLIAYLGLNNTFLIYPVGSLIVGAGLISSQGWVSASIAHLYRKDFQVAFQFPVDSLLYNAVPLRVKGRARAFISGLISPAGLLLGGLLLLLPLVSSIWYIPTIIGVAAGVYVVSTLVIRKLYSQALIKMLEQEDYSFLLSQEASDLSVADPATLKVLKQKLRESTDPKFVIFMAQLISQIGGREVVSILGDVAKQSHDADTRSGLIDVLVAADLGGDEIHQLYTEFLSDPDGQVRQSAIAGMEQLVGPDHEEFLKPALKMLEDPDVEVRTQILSMLAHSKDFYALPAAVQALDELLAQEDPHQRAKGVLVLGQIAQVRTKRSLTDVTRPVYRLTTHLTDSEDDVRLQAALGIERISKNKLTGQLAEIILQQMSGLINDPVERIRQATLTVYGRLGQEEGHPILVKALTDASPQIRAAAVDAIVEVGDKSIIPVIRSHLNSDNLQQRKMAAIVLSRINPREFGDRIDLHITDNLYAIYNNYGRIEALSACAKYPSVSVLQSALQEQNQALIDEIFYLLTAIHDPQAVEVVTTSLLNKDERIRANAIEALEALITPQTAHLIAPLFESGITPAEIVHLSKNTWEMPQPEAAEALEQLITDPDAPWLRALTAIAISEIGASLAANEPRTDHISQPNEPAINRPSPVDPLNVLTNTDDEAKSKRRNRGRVQPADLLGMLAGRPQDSSPQPPKRDEVSDRLNSSSQAPFALPEIESMLESASADPIDDVRLAVQVARRILAGYSINDTAKKEEILLSTIERIIFLKQVPFFKGMTINQLEVLANICEEELFEEDKWIFHQGDPGGALYVIVSGQVGIEQEKRKGSYARLATLGANTSFGEMTLFDGSPRSASAIALQDTLILRLRREPLIALARRYPDVSLELIHILSERLRQANNRIAELTRSRPRELQKLFDKFD